MTTTEPRDLPVDWEIRELLASTPVSRTWRILAAGRPAVLRRDEPGAGRLGLNRVDEPGVLRAAAAAGLGPGPLGADPARGLLLTDWLPGRAWSAADLRAPENLRRAAALLRQVHGLPVSRPVLDLAAVIDRYAAAGGAGADGLAPMARERLALALDGAPVLAAGRLRLCHNDPTPGNFIAAADGTLRLIDWEYAGLCHPAFDLAGLALGAGLDPAGDELLLGAYAGQPPGPAGLARHGAWKDFCRALAALWAAALIE
ncbi:MAG: phosphotransferase [Gammaproteobacteria bacterium]